MRNYLPRIGRYHLILAASLAATPSFAADPDQGETLARRWCTGCHLVATDQKAATTDAPPFASIALIRRRSNSSCAIRIRKCPI
jgi:cytochrome c2